MRFTLFAALMAMIVSGCATSKNLKSEYLTGDGVFPLKRIERALVRNAVVYKPRLSKNQNPTELGNATQISKAATQVSVRMIPFTKPLVASRATQAMNTQAKRQKWSDHRLRNEIRNAISSDTIKYVSGKQCFDTLLLLAGAKQKGKKAVPAELDPRNWSGIVTQDGRNYALSVIEGPHCSGLGGRAFSSIPFRLRFGTTKDVECRLVTCTSASVNLHESFNVEYRPRFQQNLMPVVINWPGSKGIHAHLKNSSSPRNFVVIE